MSFTSVSADTFLVRGCVTQLFGEGRAVLGRQVLARARLLGLKVVVLVGPNPSFAGDVRADPRTVRHVPATPRQMATAALAAAMSPQVDLVLLDEPRELMGFDEASDAERACWSEVLPELRGRRGELPAFVAVMGEATSSWKFFSGRRVRVDVVGAETSLTLVKEQLSASQGCQYLLGEDGAWAQRVPDPTGVEDVDL